MFALESVTSWGIPFKIAHLSRRFSITFESLTPGWASDEGTGAGLSEPMHLTAEVQNRDR
jgi:hypothetical protein